jgi:hypothetical protein
MEMAYLKEKLPIKITVEGGPILHNTIQLSIGPYASLEDWINVFKIILVHQTFTFETINELFESEYKESITKYDSIYFNKNDAAPINNLYEPS